MQTNIIIPKPKPNISQKAQTNTAIPKPSITPKDQTTKTTTKTGNTPKEQTQTQAQKTKVTPKTSIKPKDEKPIIKKEDEDEDQEDEEDEEDEEEEDDDAENDINQVIADFYYKNDSLKTQEVTKTEVDNIKSFFSTMKKNNKNVADFHKNFINNFVEKDKKKISVSKNKDLIDKRIKKIKEIINELYKVKAKK